MIIHGYRGWRGGFWHYDAAVPRDKECIGSPPLCYIPELVGKTLEAYAPLTEHTSRTVGRVAASQHEGYLC